MTATPERPAEPRTNVRWRILALLVFLSFVGYLLRTNMSVAGESMTRELGLSPVQLGWVLAGFAWGYALFQFPGGLLGDRLGSRRALALIAVLWAALNLLVALVPGSAGTLTIIVILASLRFLMGAAQAPLFPVLGGHAIARWFPPSGWALPNGFTNTGLTLGAAATGPLIAWLVQSYGWRASFALTAPVALLSAGLWWWYARDEPSEHPDVGAGEAAFIRADRPAAPPELDSLSGWSLVVRSREVQLITLSYFLENYVFYFFFNWLYIYLVEVRGFAQLQGGALAAVPWVFAALTATIGGWTCDRLTRSRGLRTACRSVIMPGLALSGICLLAAGAAAGPYVAVLYLALCLGSQQFTDAAYWAAATSVGGRHSAVACGVMNTGGNVVGGIVALLVPFTAQAVGWPVALATASLCAFLGAVLWFWIRADRSIEGL